MTDLFETEPQAKKRIKQLVIDGNNLAARANFVEPNLRSPDDRKTGVVYVAIRSIKMLVEKFDPEEIIMVFDRGWSQRRLDIYPEYKANRKNDNKTEEEIKEKEEYIEQIKRLRLYIEQLPIKQVQVKSTEADDIIAYICNKHIKLGQSDNLVLVSTDSDFYQFVSLGIKVYNPIDHLFIDELYIRNKFDVKSKDYLFYKSMLGDKTDNITAVKGFGAKAASSLFKVQDVNELQDLKEIAKTQKGKKFEKFVEGFDNIERNYQLIDLTKDYLDEDTKIEIEKQLEQKKVFDGKLFDLCEEDGMAWDAGFFKGFERCNASIF